MKVRKYHSEKKGPLTKSEIYGSGPRKGPKYTASSDNNAKSNNDRKDGRLHKDALFSPETKTGVSNTPITVTMTLINRYTAST